MNRTTTIEAREKQAFRALELAGRLRLAEKLILGFLAYSVFACWVFPLSLRERLVVFGLNLVASMVVCSLSLLTRGIRSELLLTLRDWLPAVLILLAYRESGLFFIPDPTHRLDFLFGRWDSILLKNSWLLSALSSSPWFQRYLEFSYFLCYPLVPLGFGSLYSAGRQEISSRGGGSHAERTFDHFWTTVLLALFCCYVLFPLFPSTPPRLFFHEFARPELNPAFRKINFWILGQYGIQSSVFPSGHVAGVTATALAVCAHRPRLGVIFLVAAFSVALATVYGRYHYAADALAGALIALAAFHVSNRLHSR